MPPTASNPQFLIFLLEPAERSRCSSADLAHLGERRADLDDISAHVAASPDGSPFARVVDVGQRIDTVMRTWLREHRDRPRRLSGPDVWRYGSPG